MVNMKFSKVSRVIFSLMVWSLISVATSSFAQEQNSSKKVDFGGEPKEYIVGDISTEGLTQINSRLLMNTTTLNKGDKITIPGDKLGSVTKKLMEQRHFSDIVTKTIFRGDTVDITFVFKERLRVSQWVFIGTKGSEAKDIQEKLKLRRNSELSDFVLMTAVEGIKDFYYDKGFRNAEIDLKVESDSMRSNYVVVSFDVVKNKRVLIGDIIFEGNENIESKYLTRAMKKSKKVSINFFADHKFSEENFAEDKASIIAYYKSKGYRDIEIVRDSLFTIEDNRLGIWMEVNEGQKFYYGDITWIGNSKISTQHLNEMLGLRTGDVYDSETMGKRLGSIMGEQGDISIASLYRDDGYLAFAIEPVERVEQNIVDVEIRIIEDRQFRINKVTFDGNSRTNDHVIRREMDTRPGELYSQSLLMRTYQKLATMGQFDTESFAAPNIMPDFQSQTVDIGYALQEVSKDQFELSGGWGSGMFIGSIGVSFNNISVRKFFDKDAWRPYPSGDAQTLSIKLQTNGSYYTAGSLSFTEPWLGGEKPTSLSVSMYLSEETNAYYWGQDISASFFTFGASVSVGKRLNWPDPYFIASVGLSYQSYYMYDWSYFILQNGRSNIVALNLAFGRSSIDDPTGYPTRGSEVMLTAAITPPWSAFDGKDYSDANMTSQERYLWVEYYKLKFDAKWFTPISADNKLVLMTRAQFGYLGAYNDDKTSPFEGFQVGGDGLSTYSVYGVETIGLRGYENMALTPYYSYGYYSSVYTKLTAELRYPLVRSSGTMVYGLIFAEAGNAYENVEDYKPFNLKRSLGVGLRIYLPILGMLGVDWGYGFDAVSSDTSSPSGSQFHFTMGSTF